MPVDLNNVAASVAAQLKTINDSVNVGGQGTAQAADLANIKQTLVDNKDTIEANVGEAAYSKMQNDITLLNADFRDGAAASGGAGEAFNADLSTFVTDLNNAGLQVELDTGNGHYDQTSEIANAGGSNITGGQFTEQATANAAKLQKGLETMNGSEKDGVDYVQGFNDAKSAMDNLVNGAFNWYQGANLSDSQKGAFADAYKKAQAADDAFSANPSQGNAFKSTYNDLVIVMNGIGYNGITKLA